MAQSLEFDNLLNKAFKIAQEAHMGQVDKAGKAYINHILYVVEHVETTKEKILAYLHDIIEDTDVDISFIRKEFGDEITDALLAITRLKNENYFDYIARVKENPLARVVKIVDLQHNMQLERLGDVCLKDMKRVERYKKAMEYLKNGI